MSFMGALIKVGDKDLFFNRFIIASTYKVTKKIIDIDSYRDANGVLHRNAMDHVSYVVEFDIKPLDNHRLQEFMSNIRNHFIEPKERKLLLNFYLPEDDVYRENIECYMPDPDFTIIRITENEIYYDKTTIKFIAY